MTQRSTRATYCLRCTSQKIVRGTLGEAARFYPERGWLKSLFGKPLVLSQVHSHACLDCGLTWNEVDAQALRQNLKEYGLSPHRTVVMQVVEAETVKPLT